MEQQMEQQVDISSLLQESTLCKYVDGQTTTYYFYDKNGPHGTTGPVMRLIGTPLPNYFNSANAYALPQVPSPLGPDWYSGSYAFYVSDFPPDPTSNHYICEIASQGATNYRRHISNTCMSFFSIGDLIGKTRIDYNNMTEGLGINIHR